jgi:hypothetical protein
MKKILIGALMMITSYGAQAQNNLIDMDVQSTPTIEEVQMSEEVVDTIPQRRVGPPHFGHPAPPMVRMPLLPKPQRIIRKGDEVILIFTKSDWARYENIKRWHYLRNRRKHVTEIGWQKRVENNSMPKDYLEKNHKFDK